MDERPHLDSNGDDDDDSTAASGRGRDARLDALRAAIERGLDDIKAGRVADVEAAFDRVEAMLDELEAAKRSGG
ncbi:MAG TPA: hypothetical protein VFP12_11595 [Allosphingosinicella sp.]|nr:hypothetical protein [Allosphingosinicella sp.]